MWPTKRQLDNVRPLSADDSDSRRKIVKTVEALQLDPDKITLVGSAAMHMYGIDPPFIHDRLKIDQRLGSRPYDIDLVVPSIYWNDLARAEETPNGLPLTRRLPDTSHKAPFDINVLKFSAENYPDLFPVDIFTDFIGRTREDGIRHDAKLEQIREKHSHAIPGTDIRVLSLGRIATMLRRRGPDPKARSDLEAIKFAYRHNKLPGKNNSF